MFTAMLSTFWGVDYTIFGALCDCTMAIVNNSDAAWSFIVTTYPAL